MSLLDQARTVAEKERLRKSDEERRYRELIAKKEAVLNSMMGSLIAELTRFDGQEGPYGYFRFENTGVRKDGVFGFLWVDGHKAAWFKAVIVAKHGPFADDPEILQPQLIARVYGPKPGAGHNGSWDTKQAAAALNGGHQATAISVDNMDDFYRTLAMHLAVWL